MKVIIIPNYPGMRGRHYSIASALVEHGHEVHYFLWELPYHMRVNELVRHFMTSLFAKEYRYENFTMHKVSRLPYFWPYVNGWLFKYQLNKLYKRIGADVVFSESYTNETGVPKNLPLIYDLADDYAAPAEVFGSRIYKLAFRLLAIRSTMKHQTQNALAVTVVSSALYKYAKQYNDNVFVLPNGVERDIIEKIIKTKSTNPKNKYSMVYVTGFGQWSRSIETMQAVTELRKEFPAIELNLIGDGSEVEKIKHYIKDNHAEDYIHYLGLILNREVVFSHINMNAIGLNTSIKNKFRDAAHPIKVLEYSALGKKVVSSNLKEVKALNFPNVFIFKDKDGELGIKNAMRSALRSQKDYRAYSSVSQYVLATYNWSSLVNELVIIINKSLFRDA